MFLHGRCAKLARVHFNLSFTGSANEALTSQQMGHAKQFCLLGQAVPEHVAFISSGVACWVRDCRVLKSEQLMELLNKHVHVHRSKMTAVVSALLWSNHISLYLLCSVQA